MARAATWFALAGGVVLLVLVGFTVVDAVLRYWFSRPIHGSFDITQALLALIVASSIAYGGVSGAHVSLDLLPKPPRAIALAVRWAGIAVLAILAWRCVTSGLSAVEFGGVSPLLGIPYLPLYFALALGVAGYALVLAAGGEEKHE